MLLNEKIAAQLPTQRERYRALAKEHSEVVVADVTVGQIVGGMRIPSPRQAIPAEESKSTSGECW